jgi:hypothetical protein
MPNKRMKYRAIKDTASQYALDSQQVARHLCGRYRDLYGCLLLQA